MDQDRFNRLEDKVDRLKDDVTEVKVGLEVHSKTMIEKMNSFEDHIAGDNKIISHLKPVLEKLPTIVEMAEEHTFRKRQEEDRKKKLASYKAKLTAVSITIGVLLGAYKLYTTF